MQYEVYAIIIIKARELDHSVVSGLTGVFPYRSSQGSHEYMYMLYTYDANIILIEYMI